uniref:Uncharacterized protein n=1 Tax=Arundo donax TaxID=35708 RepID=A0A0A9TX86_ARUDO
MVRSEFTAGGDLFFLPQYPFCIAVIVIFYELLTQCFLLI